MQIIKQEDDKLGPLLGRNIGRFASYRSSFRTPNIHRRFRRPPLLYTEARNNPPLAIIKYLEVLLGQIAYSVPLPVADYHGDQHRIHFDYDFGGSVLGWRALSHLGRVAHAQQKTQATQGNRREACRVGFRNNPPILLLCGPRAINSMLLKRDQGFSAW